MRSRSRPSRPSRPPGGARLLSLRLFSLRRGRGRWLAALMAGLLLLAGLVLAVLPGGILRQEAPLAGMVWQPDTATVAPEGAWQELGADTLLVQWIEVDGIGFAPGLGRPAPRLPDWRAIARRPWARQVILGLAGEFSEARARADTLRLARRSARVAQVVRETLPVEIAGYYFPVEVDPTWAAAPRVMTEALALLPRPLWISVYDSANIGGAALADWLAGWLPGDVGIFFQDGVGVEARSAPVARAYADALAARLGRDRVRVIVEAFRPGLDRPFRPATAAELVPQIRAMRGYPIYLFDGPHYVDDALVAALREALDGALDGALGGAF